MNPTAILKNLETFVVAANSYGFQIAADKLHVTVSAVSRRIKQLEDEVGVPLFERDASGAKLTPQGQEFLETAETIIKVVGDGVNRVREHESHTLRIATLNPIARFFLLPNLPQFKAKHPDIELDISVQPDLNPQSKESFDISLSVDAVAGDAGEALATFIGSVLCSPMGVNGASPPASIEELGNHTLLCYSQTPDLWNRVFAAFGQPKPNKLQLKMYNDAELLLQAAAQGLGVAVGTAPFANPLVESGKLIDPFNHLFSTGDGIVLRYGPGSQHNPSVVLFAAWAAEIIPAVYKSMTES